jgi:hypothetical protein
MGAPFGMRALALVAAFAAMLLAGSPGIRPRAAVTDYPAHQATASVTVGAAVIPRADVKKIFATDLNSGGYVVVEVGVFPPPVGDVDLSPGDFTLLTDAGRIAVRPVDADTVAGAIGRAHDPSRPKHPDVYTTTGVEISHGPAYDPSTGRRTGGTVVRVEEGGGTQPYPVPSTGPNRGAMEQELWEKSLPDGRTSVPVAGYLYFPKPSGGTKGAMWELTMDGAAGRIKLVLQNPDKR